MIIQVYCIPCTYFDFVYKLGKIKGSNVFHGILEKTIRKLWKKGTTLMFCTDYMYVVNPSTVESYFNVFSLVRPKKNDEGQVWG